MDNYHPNGLRPSGSNRPHIPPSIPTNPLSIVPTNTISIRSINRLSLSSPTHLHPDDPSSSLSPSQQSPDTDSPDGPTLNQLPPHGDPPPVEPSSGAHRTLKSNARDTVINLKAPKDDRERRKRNRVTPEQLVQLEAAFSKDRSPTSTERRELSNRIGMAERAVQIWFQNRRAKAKHQPPRPAPPTSNPPPLSGSPPASPPLGMAQEETLTNILNEREDIKYFPVTDIAIGHWRRIHATHSDRDLVAYWAPQSQRLCWFIHSGGLSFRMDIPFTSVATAKVYNKSPTRLAVYFDLNKPPTFLIQQPRSYNQLPSSVRRFPPLGVTAGEWASCRDWTEDNQASKVLRHEITGSPDDLLPAIQCLSSVLHLVYGPNTLPPKPPNDQPPPRPEISVATNAQVNSVSSLRALSQSPPSTYQEIQPGYPNIIGFPQLENFPPQTGLHSPTLPVEMHQPTTTIYPPSYLTERPSFPPVMSDSANQTVPHMNTYRLLTQPTYQYSRPFMNAFPTSPSTASQGRGEVNHTQNSGEALATGLAGESTMFHYRTSSTGHPTHASIESIPTISDSTLLSEFPNAGILGPPAPMDGLMARAPLPQHELHSHLQGYPFQTSNVPTDAYYQMPPSTTPNAADWTYSLMAMPYIHPSHIQQDLTPYTR